MNGISSRTRSQKTLKRKRGENSASPIATTATTRRRTVKSTKKQKHEILLHLSSHSAQLCNNLKKNEVLRGINVKMMSYMTNYGDDSETCNEYHANRYEEMDELGLNLIIRNTRNPSACVSSYPPEDHATIKQKIKENYMLASLECTANVLHNSYNDYISTKRWAKEPTKEKYERGFQIIEPIKDKGYWFEPNEGEDKEIPGYDPHYGLHIIHVINPIHKSFEQFNVHNHEKDLLDYGNITNTYKLKYAGITDIFQNIKIIRDAILTIADEKIRTKCNIIYNKMVYKETKKTEAKSADKITGGNDAEKEDEELDCTSLNNVHSCAKLSEILYLFKHLGFTDIYLIDPACKGFWNDNCKSKTETDKILKREIFTRQKIAQDLSPEMMTPHSAKSVSVSAPSLKKQKTDFTIKGKVVRGIFYYEDENDPNELKSPDWNSEEGVPTRYGRVHSLNQYFKKHFLCAYFKGQDDPCKKSLLNEKPSKNDKKYNNEESLGLTHDSKSMAFYNKYKKEIFDNKFDQIPDK